MEQRIVSAVGNMREILGVRVVLGWLVVLGEVERVGKKVEVSHFSPTEATEEIWATMCG